MSKLIVVILVAALTVASLAEPNPFARPNAYPTFKFGGSKKGGFNKGGITIIALPPHYPAYGGYGGYGGYGRGFGGYRVGYF